MELGKERGKKVRSSGGGSACIQYMEQKIWKRKTLEW